MSNQLRGLCHDCVANTKNQKRVSVKEQLCQKCLKKNPQLISDGQAICLGCYLMESSPPKSEAKSTPRRYNTVIQSPFRQVQKSDLKKSFFGTSLIEKIQKLFDNYFKISELKAYMQKKAISSGEINWEKLTNLVDGKQSLSYIFVFTDYIFGGFHVEQIKLKNKQEIECKESGIFITERTKNNIKFFRVKGNSVDYSKQTISFGKPSSLTITFNEGVRVKTELLPDFNQLKWLMIIQSPTLLVYYKTTYFPKQKQSSMNNQSANSQDLSVQLPFQRSNINLQQLDLQKLSNSQMNSFHKPQIQESQKAKAQMHDLQQCSTIITKLKSLDFTLSFPLLKNSLQSIEDQENGNISQDQIFQMQKQQPEQLQQKAQLSNTNHIKQKQKQKQINSIQQKNEQAEAKLKEFQLKKKFILNIFMIINKNNSKCLQQTFNCFKMEQSQNSDQQNFQFKGIRSSSSKRKSQQSEDFNLQLTMKSKNTKNFQNLSRQDSLMYSNSSFGANLDHSVSPLRKKQSMLKNQKHSESNRQLLKKIEDIEEPDGILTLNKSQSKQIFQSTPFANSNGHIQQELELQINQNQQIKIQNNNEEYQNQNLLRNNKNLGQKDTQKMQLSRLSIESRSFNSNIFQTELPTKKNSITKIREDKQIKKRKLQQQLQKINKEIQEIKINQNKSRIQGSINSYSSRQSISDDNLALIRAEGLVRNMRYEKNNRMIAKIDLSKKVDKSIDQYMKQLTKMRAENENRLKQKKKIQILDRMKKKQAEKAQFIKKKQQNLRLMANLKFISKSNQIPSKSLKKKAQDHAFDLNSPELFNRKASLNKVRNVFVKRQRVNYNDNFLID